MDGGTPRRDIVCMRAAFRLHICALYACVFVYARESCVVSSDGFNFHFPYLLLSPFRSGFIAQRDAHLPTLTRKARGVYRFYHETSVFTFRYNYTLMRGDRRRKRFCVIHAIDDGSSEIPFSLSSLPRYDQHTRYMMSDPSRAFLFRVVPFLCSTIYFTT